MKTFRGMTYIVGILLVLLASCTSRSGGTLEDKGKVVELTTKEHMMKALKMAPPVEGTFILIQAEAFIQPESMTYLDGQFSLITQEDYEKVFDTFIRWARFGDLFSYEEGADIISLQ